VLIHLTKEEVLGIASKKHGHKVIGDAVFSNLLEANMFIQNLGRGDLDVKRLGTSVFIVVLRSSKT